MQGVSGDETQWARACCGTGPVLCQTHLWSTANIDGVMHVRGLRASELSRPAFTSLACSMALTEEAPGYQWPACRRLMAIQVRFFINKEWIMYSFKIRK